jgi:hypothetical protein
MPNINNINVNRANKAIYNKDARKLVARLGNNERLVLRYAVLVSRRFTISDIVTYFSNLKHRRIWDTVQRLVKKGFVRKVDRGIYELAKDIDKSVLDMDLGNTRKENLLFGDGGGGSGVVGVGGVVRIHGNGRSVLDYYRRVYFAYRLLSCVVRRLESTLLSLGFGRSFLARVRRGVSAAVSNVCFNDGVIGCHGRYKKRFKGLKPLSLCVDGFYYEYGVDIEVGDVSGVLRAVGGKPFVKVYLYIP